MEQPLQPLKSHAELAYDFFAESERTQRCFTSRQLAEATGYTEETARSYLTKKWWWFVKKEQQGLYTVHDFVGKCSLQTFLDDLRQKTKRPAAMPQVRYWYLERISLPLALASMLVLGVWSIVLLYLRKRPWWIVPLFG
jgi:hypothetical protein